MSPPAILLMKRHRNRDCWVTAVLPDRAMPTGLVKAVGGAAHGSGASVEHVGVDHRRGDVAVAEELLDGPNVVAALEQVGGEGVTERVRTGTLAEARTQGSLLHRALDDRFVEVMAAPLTARELDVHPRRRKDALPRPLSSAFGYLRASPEGSSTQPAPC